MVVLFVLLLYLMSFILKKLALEFSHHFDIGLGVTFWILFCISLFVYFNWLTTYKLDVLLLASLFEDAFEFLNILLDPLFHTGVPMILDSVVSSAFKYIGYIRPFVCMVSV